MSKQDRDFYVQKALNDLQWTETQIKHSRTVDIRNALKSKGCVTVSVSDQSVVPEMRKALQKTKEKPRESMKLRELREPKEPMSTFQLMNGKKDICPKEASSSKQEETAAVSSGDKNNLQKGDVSPRTADKRNMSSLTDKKPTSDSATSQNISCEVVPKSASATHPSTTMDSSPKPMSWDIAEIERQVTQIKKSVQQYYQSLEKNANLSTGEDEEIVQLATRMRRCNLEMYRSKLTDQMEICEQFLDPLIVRRTLLQNESAFLKSNSETYRGDTLYKQTLDELLAKSVQIEQETFDKIEKVQLLSNQLKACLKMCQE